MPMPFSRTVRSLHDDGGRLWLAGIAGASLLLGIWGVWFFAGHVIVWESTESARVEAIAQPHPVHAPVAGRVTNSQLTLAKTVQEGEVLLELDSQAQTLERQEASTRKKAIEAQLPLLRSEIDATETALLDSERASQAGLGETSARKREAEARAEYADQESQRYRSLHDAGHIAELKMLKSNAEQRTSQPASKRSRSASHASNSKSVASKRIGSRSSSPSGGWPPLWRASRALWMRHWIGSH